MRFLSVEVNFAGDRWLENLWLKGSDGEEIKGVRKLRNVW